VTSARRFFIEGARKAGSFVEIGGGDAHKITSVLRLREGDRIEIVDSTATAFAAAISAIGRTVRARLIEPLDERRDEGARVEFDIAQAVPKGRRMEFVVEKGTELGASAFVPFFCERSVRRDVGPATLERWRRLARSAAQQSGRRAVPQVLEPLSYDALLARFARYAAVLFAWELAPQVPMREQLGGLIPACGRVLVVVGPEGGFTHNEAESAATHGAALIWLGARVLRTDTAAVALLAVIGAFTS
jgi:16S rRNA (uracil1498-N3)-methyltransferase